MGSIEQERSRRPAVPARTADFLIIGVDRLADVVVEDKTNVGLVDRLRLIPLERNQRRDDDGGAVGEGCGIDTAALQRIVLLQDLTL